MRIAYVLDVFPTVSETFIVREIQALKQRGEDVAIIAVAHGPTTIMHDESIALLDEVEFIPDARKSRSKLSVVPLHLKYLLWNPSGYLNALIKGLRGSRKVLQYFLWSPFHADRVRRAGIQHMHAHFVLNGCLHAMFVSLLTRIPYSVTVHAHDIFHPKYEELRGEKLKRAAFVVAISRFNKNFLETNYPFLVPGKIQIVRCGIDPDGFAVTSKPDRRDERKVLAIGRLVEQKGFAYLIEACALLRLRGVGDFTVDIIGEGIERAELEARIRNLGLQDSVNMLGQKDQVHVRAALDAADLFVLPCVQEASGMMDGIPVALMEAMAKGIPVISTSVSGVPELIVDGGYVVEPANVERLADAMQELLTMTSVERKALGARGRDVVAREFNIHLEAEKLAALIGR